MKRHKSVAIKLSLCLLALAPAATPGAAPVLTAYLMVAFVPLETSSRLLPEDLLDEPELCLRLGHQGDTPPDRLAAAIREGLPSATRQMVEQRAKETGNDHTSTGQASLLLDGLVSHRTEATGSAPAS